MFRTDGDASCEIRLRRGRLKTGRDDEASGITLGRWDEVDDVRLIG